MIFLKAAINLNLLPNFLNFIILQKNEPLYFCLKDNAELNRKR